MIIRDTFATSVKKYDKAKDPMIKRYLSFIFLILPENEKLSIEKQIIQNVAPEHDLLMITDILS